MIDQLSDLQKFNFTVYASRNNLLDIKKLIETFFIILVNLKLSNFRIMLYINNLIKYFNLKTFISYVKTS